MTIVLGPDLGWLSQVVDLGLLKFVRSKTFMVMTGGIIALKALSDIIKEPLYILHYSTICV